MPIDTDQAFEDRSLPEFDESEADDRRHEREAELLRQCFDRMEIAAIYEALQMYGPSRMGSYTLWQRLRDRLAEGRKA